MTPFLENTLTLSSGTQNKKKSLITFLKNPRYSNSLGIPDITCPLNCLLINDNMWLQNA